MIDHFVLQYMFVVEWGEERRGDEPRLQFAFITQSRFGAEVELEDTGRLADGHGDRRLGMNISAGIPGSVRTFRLPSPEFHYFGLAVRAIEDDSSDEADRREDKRIFQSLLKTGLDPIFRRGALPTGDDIWRIANGVPLQDKRGDDDDKIGVSVRSYPGTGYEIEHLNDGDVYVPSNRMRFVGDDARWTLDFEIYGGRL